MNGQAQRAETKLPSERRFADRVGLLAGSGRFPFYFAESARRLGIEVVCVAIRDNADPDLRQVVSRFHWTSVSRLGRMLRCFQREKIRCVVMAGKVQKAAMFTPFRWFRHVPDWRMLRFWWSRERKDNKDDSLLLALIDEFEREGITFASALEICPELLVKEGILTRRQPTPMERTDIAFGWSLAKEMGRLDVGQSVAVKESAVLAIEAIEGTDAAIIRAGALCPSGGFTVVKVAKPKQDMRFDVPTIGAQTIETLRRAGAAVLAIEADKTILLDLDQTIRRADELGLCLVALSSKEALEANAA